ncbi:ArsR/SmtB family transcription factor [Sphingomonas sp.]|uniref:ArsR/SmtB family transcription factor n=1 Tax=Sphingomonas sp. TaxID=28214 RepID=UPI003B3A5E63
MSITGLAEAAALMGEPARTAMLVALMDGRALTAGELARVAGVRPQTASGHLGRMVQAALLAGEQQGRHCYYRLASPAVAKMIEAMMVGAAPPPIRTGPQDAEMRHARTCYDHLAGATAVALADTLIVRGLIAVGEDGALLTEGGRTWLAELGVEIAPAPGTSVIFCRLCLDWSERRHHLGGAIGTALYRAFAAQGWIQRVAGSRSVTITISGKRAMQHYFGIDA